MELSAGELAEGEPEWLVEATIVGRAQDGDLTSFETLVRRYQGPVFGLARRMLTDRGEAEDVVQDTFLAVWRQLPSLRDPRTFSGWVFQIATRRCLNVVRARARRPVDATDTAALETGAQNSQTQRDPATDPAATTQHRAELAGLDEVLLTLSPEHRACWILRELHGLSYVEIAAATQLPVSTVRGRIARARHLLVEGMNAWR